MKFNNTTTRGHDTDDQQTTNHEDAPAWRASDPRMHLWKLVTANLLEDTYYRTDEQALAQVRDAVDAVAETDPAFVLQMAAYAREDLYQRDIAQVLLVLAAHDERFHGRAQPDNDQSPGLIRAYAPLIIQRADEPATCVAIHNALFGADTTLPKPLKRAISDALGQFDAYQLSKYQQPTREVSLVDVLNVVRPDPAAAEWFGGDAATQAERYNRLTKGEKDDHPDVEPLDPPKTWEHVLSNAPDEWSERQKWVEVLPDMGLFATIRNLRNMREAGLSGAEIFDAAEGVNPNPPDMTDVRRSKVYPFRFYQAYKALRGDTPRRTTFGMKRTTDLHDAGTKSWLKRAMSAAIENVPTAFAETNTLVAVDASGSMDHPLSENSSISQKEIAAFLGAVLASAGDRVTVGVFGDDYQTVRMRPADGVMTNTDRILRAGENVGNSTNGWKALDYAAANERHLTAGLAERRPRAYDRVVMVTDTQIWDSTQFGQSRTVADAYEDYALALQNHHAERPPLYMLDVASYGDFAIPSDYEDVIHVSGWSEEVLDFIALREQDDPLADVRDIEPRGLTVRGMEPTVAFDGGAQ